jgi:hypothetical protein
MSDYAYNLVKLERGEPAPMSAQDIEDSRCWGCERLEKEVATLKLAYGLTLSLHGCGGENCTEAAYRKDAEEMMEEIATLKDENKAIVDAVAKVCHVMQVNKITELVLAARKQEPPAQEKKP